jgi:hypothetical protein
VAKIVLRLTRDISRKPIITVGATPAIRWHTREQDATRLASSVCYNKSDRRFGLIESMTHPRAFAAGAFMTGYLESDGADLDGTWTIYRGVEDGIPFVIRLRTDLGDVAGDRSLSKLLQISWSYFVDATSDNGMPTDAQQDEMATFENRVVDAVQKSRLAILVSVNTRAGMRRWLLYLGNRDKVEQGINAVLDGDASLPIHMTMIEDPSWNFYRNLLAIAKSG